MLELPDPDAEVEAEVRKSAEKLLLDNYKLVWVLDVARDKLTFKLFLSIYDRNGFLKPGVESIDNPFSKDSLKFA